MLVFTACMMYVVIFFASIVFIISLFFRAIFEYSKNVINRHVCMGILRMKARVFYCTTRQTIITHRSHFILMNNFTSFSPTINHPSSSSKYSVVAVFSHHLSLSLFMKLTAKFLKLNKDDIEINFWKI